MRITLTLFDLKCIFYFQMKDLFLYKKIFLRQLITSSEGNFTRKQMMSSHFTNVIQFWVLFWDEKKI